MKNYLLIILSFATSGVVGQSLDSVTLEELLCFFNPKETVLDLTFETSEEDTVVFSMEIDQILMPRFREKHDLKVVGGKAHFTDTLPLEMPVRIRIHINGVDDELFIVPGFNAHVKYEMGQGHCRGCTLEWPHDSVLVSKLPEQDFTLIKVCMVSGQKACTRTIKDQNLAGYHLISNEAWDHKIQAHYQLQGYPRYVLMDRKGIVIDGWCEPPSDSTLLPKINEAINN